MGKHCSTSSLVIPKIQLIRPFPTPISATKRFMARMFLLAAPILAGLCSHLFWKSCPVPPACPLFPTPRVNPQSQIRGETFELCLQLPGCRDFQGPLPHLTTSTVLEVSAPALQTQRSFSNPVPSELLPLQWPFTSSLYA